MSKVSVARETTIKVGIDAHMAGSRETGNETYIVSLVRGLSALAARDESYMVYTLGRPPELEGLPAGRFATAELVPRQDFIRLPLVLPIRAWRDRLAVLHVTYHMPPLCPCPVVVTIHDISFRFFPSAFSRRDLVILSTLVPFSARKAAKIITVSHRSKSDLMKQYAVPGDKIVVTHYAAGEEFRPVRDETTLGATCARYNIRRPYILAVGNLQPRKNLRTLIEAHARLRLDGVVPHQLVLVGHRRWRHQEILHTAAEQASDVVFTGYIPKTDLVALYSAAHLFVYPSLYEGFGLPVLEAMACGAPVVASTGGALPEVAGDAAILVNPCHTDNLADAVAAVLSDDSLRRDLIRRGFERSRQFNWAETARQTLEVYREVAEEWD